MSKVGEDIEMPRAMVHKNILDVAKTRPNASLEELASAVSGASIELVERVLEEYGDPSEADAQLLETDGSSQDSSNVAPESVGDEASAPDLTTKQRKTLGLVAENPDASQSVIADELGVTRATVSRRLNAIPGFEWEDRDQLAPRLLGAADEHGSGSDALDAEETPAAERDEDETENQRVASNSGQSSDTETQRNRVTDSAQSGDGDTLAVAEANQARGRSNGGTGPSLETENGTLGNAVDRLTQSVTALESRIEEMDGRASASEVSPELVHKVMHACMESEDISSREELAILRQLLGE